VAVGAPHAPPITVTTTEFEVSTQVPEEEVATTEYDPAAVASIKDVETPVGVPSRSHW
jgi:hypothetical protein